MHLTQIFVALWSLCFVIPFLPRICSLFFLTSLLDFY